MRNLITDALEEDRLCGKTRPASVRMPIVFDALWSLRSTCAARMHRRKCRPGSAQSSRGTTPSRSPAARAPASMRRRACRHGLGKGVRLAVRSVRAPIVRRTASMAERRRQVAAPPDRELGYAAAAATVDFVGSVGAGTGAVTVNRKGRIGPASARTPRPHRGGAAAVNAVGSVTWASLVAARSSADGRVRRTRSAGELSG